METAKVFTSGRSQAVRIPKKYRFTASEVYINKVGDALILTPADKLGSVYDEGLAMFTDDFFADALLDETSGVRYTLDKRKETP